MSVDAHELERGALKRKDREQLLIIASALGKKPPGRARKDQIIDLILGIAPEGVPSGEAGPDEPSDRPASPRPSAPAPSPAVVAAEPLPFESAPAAPPAPAPAPTPAPAVVAGSVAVPPSPAPVASAAAPANASGSAAASPAAAPVASFSPFEGGAGPAFRRNAPSTTESSGAATDNGAPGERARGLDERSDRSDVEDRGDADRGDADRGDGERNEADRGDGSDREGTSRRRRRRGRDKDRDRTPQLPVASPVVPSPERTDRVERPERVERPDRNDRNERNDRVDRNDRNDRPDRDRSERAGDDAPVGGSNNDPVAVSGHLDLRDEGYGFLRVKGYLPSKEDVYVPAKFVRQFGLRKGDQLVGSSRPAGRGEKNPALLRIDEVNGADPESSRTRRRFEELTPLFPDERLKLSHNSDPTNMTARIIDLISPIGKGQRGLIVSPPKAGKTTIMKTIAQCIEANNPEVKLIVLLIDERPEEVTDMRRSVQGEVVASTFDRPADEHTHVVEMTIERAKRMVEQGEDVVIILDGITRLARAYNLAAPATGRIMSGGIDTGALYPPKKFFGAARNVEEGGSLTILATALVETGSRMDEVIFEEFKGTGNMELRLDRKLAEKRIYPAIDVDASSTRHEELLFDRRQLNLVWKLRRVLSGLAADGPPGAGLELLVDRMRTFKSNDEFLAEVAKAPSM